MRFYWLYFHSLILKNTFGRPKIVRTLVMTISTAEHCTCFFFTGTEVSLTSHVGLKERDYETIGIAFGFRVLLKKWARIDAVSTRFCTMPSWVPPCVRSFPFIYLHSTSGSICVIHAYIPCSKIRSLHYLSKTSFGA